MSESVPVPVTDIPESQVALMTADEHLAMRHSADLANALARVIGDGPTRDQDLGEAFALVHGIQHLVMAQAAARAYPDLYRLAGQEGAWNG